MSPHIRPQSERVFQTGTQSTNLKWLVWWNHQQTVNFMSHMCVDIACLPSARDTHSGHVVECLFNSVPSITTICVAPKSVMASQVGSWKEAPAKAGTLRICCSARCLYEPYNKLVLEASTVASSSPVDVMQMERHNWVGYGKSVLTCNEFKHLNATLFAASNHHMFLGNCVLCLFFMEQGWLRSIYCCTIWRLNPKLCIILHKWGGHNLFVWPSAISKPQE